MKRLTKKTEEGYVLELTHGGYPWAVFEGNGFSSPLYSISGTAVDRLAAYEDTGLEPEDLAMGLNAAVRKKAGAEYYGLTPEQMDRAVDLFRAGEDGRVLVLPCKVGQTVYIVGHKFAAEIESIALGGEDGPLFEWTEYDRSSELTEVWDEGYFTEKDIGKTVFLTREEEAAALERMTNRNGSLEGG